MDYDIARYIEGLIAESQSADIAIAEFRRNIADDDELREAYSRWCETMGYQERSGYRDYIEEIIDSRNERWSSIDDYDDER